MKKYCSENKNKIVNIIPDSQILKSGLHYNVINACINENRLVIRLPKIPVLKDEFELTCECLEEQFDQRTGNSPSQQDFTENLDCSLCREIEVYPEILESSSKKEEKIHDIYPNQNFFLLRMKKNSLDKSGKHVTNFNLEVKIPRPWLKTNLESLEPKIKGKVVHDEPKQGDIKIKKKQDKKKKKKKKQKKK